MRFVPGLLLVSMLLAACSCNKPCKIHSDCSEAERCVAFACAVICRTDRDCDGLGQCVSGDCTIVGAGGGNSSGGGGGAEGGGAGGGGGSTDAGTDAGVDAGFDAGITDAGRDAGFDAGVVDAGFDAGIEDAGVVDAGLEDAGNGAGQYGDACNRGGDCASTLCVGNSLTGQKICTVVCGSESACDQGHACLPVQGPSGVVNICVPSDSGAACASGLGSTCVAGICLLHPSMTSLSVCATPCETTHACPNGFSCSLVQVGSQMQKVCSPVGNACTVRGNSNQCISRWCATLGTSPTTGMCTGNCSTSADCPAGWACGLDDDGTSYLNKCQPIGMTCAVSGGNNNCYSQACATDTPQGDYCTAFCMDGNGNQEPARCPMGWMCTNSGTTANPLWACEQ